MLDIFRTHFEAMNFESEAGKAFSMIFEKQSFVVQKRKVIITEIQPAEKLLQTLPKKSFVKKSWKKKVGKKYSLISDLNFEMCYFNRTERKRARNVRI